MPALARAWQMLLKGLEEVQTAPSPIQAAEMVLVRLAYVADLPAPAELVRARSRRPRRSFAEPRQRRRQPACNTAAAGAVPSRRRRRSRSNLAPTAGRGRSRIASAPVAGAPTTSRAGTRRLGPSSIRCRKALPRSSRSSTSIARR